MAEALYRKYRPQVFSEVVGQDHIERTLKNAIEQNKVSHAYLFCGPRGTGKTTTARLLAKALLCENGPTPNPDGTCASCQEIAQGQHPDVYELDAASRTGVENVREEIISRVQFAPTRGKYKVYIIDEVHMLSVAAFNALLKTLEEPPAHVVFILCTTDPQKVPETILSRCQRFDFRRIDNKEMTDRLAQICQAEGVSFDREALEIIAGRSDGGLRNALTALEQAIAFGDGTVSLAVVQQLGGTQAACDLATVVDALANRDIAAAFTWVDTFAQTGGDFARLAADLAQRVRDMYFLAMAGAKAPLSVPEEMRSEVIAQAKRFDPDRLAYMLTTLGDTMIQLKQASNARLRFEIALTKICHPENDITLESLAARIEALEARPALTSFEVTEAVSAATLTRKNVAADSAFEPPASEAIGTSSPEMPGASVGEVVGATSPGSLASEAIGTSLPEMSEASVGEVVGAMPPESAEASATTVGRQAETFKTAGAGSIFSEHGEARKKLEGFSNPAVVQRMWQRAFAQIKRDRPAYTSLLMSAHVSYDAHKGSLVVMFRPGYAFALTMLQKPEALEYLRQAVSQAAGADVPVEVRAEEVVEAVRASHASSVAVAAEIAPAASSGADAKTHATPGWMPDGAVPGIEEHLQAEEESYAYEEMPLDTYGGFEPCGQDDESSFAEAGLSAQSREAAPATISPANLVANVMPNSAATVAETGAAETGAAPTPAATAFATPAAKASAGAAASTSAATPSAATSAATAAEMDAALAAGATSVAGMVPAAGAATTAASSATTPTATATSQPARQEVPPWEDDPFALPAGDDPVIELDEFQKMLSSSFGDGVVVEEV